MSVVCNPFRMQLVVSLVVYLDTYCVINAIRWQSCGELNSRSGCLDTRLSTDLRLPTWRHFLLVAIILAFSVGRSRRHFQVMISSFVQCTKKGRHTSPKEPNGLVRGDGKKTGWPYIGSVEGWENTNLGFGHRGHTCRVLFESFPSLIRSVRWCAGYRRNAKCSAISTNHLVYFDSRRHHESHQSRGVRVSWWVRQSLFRGPTGARVSPPKN